MSKGHTLLVWDYRITTDDEMILTIYDCNEIGHFIYLHMDLKQPRFYFENIDEDANKWLFNMDNWVELGFRTIKNVDPAIEVEKSNEKSKQIQTYNAADAKSADVNSNEMTFKIDADCSISLVTSSGKYFTYDGEDYSTDMNIYNVDYVGEENVRIAFTVDAEDEIDIREITDKCKFSAIMGDKYFTATTIGADKVVFHVQDGISFEGEDYSFSAGMSNVTGDELVYVDANATEESELKYTDTGIEMNTEGVFDSVVIEKIDENGIDTKEIEGEFSSSTVVSDKEVSRIYGSDRYKTAFAIADELKVQLNVEAFESVIIAVGKDNKEADALTGSYLAKVKNAPILLTNGKDSVNAEVIQYIKENAKTDAAVYILGGEAAIPKSLETKLDSLGYQVKRLAGSDRYDTNLAVLNEAGLEGQTDLLIAVGNSFADSLSASATGKAILLVKPEKKGQPVSKLSGGQKAVLDQFKDGNIYILGGTGAVGAETAAQIASYIGKTADALEANRIYGADRYETSAKIAEKFFPDAEKAVIAYGKKAADGLSGGPLAARVGAPLLLTKDGNTTASEYLTENGISSGYILGGTSAISKETADKLFVVKND